MSGKIIRFLFFFLVHGNQARSRLGRFVSIGNLLANPIGYVRGAWRQLPLCSSLRYTEGRQFGARKLHDLLAA